MSMLSQKRKKNGRPEGFTGQRILVMSQDVVERSARMTVARELFLTDIGHFPNADRHFIDRMESGSKGHILIYCVDGTGTCQLAGEEEEVVRPGNVLLIPTGTPHAYWSDNTDPWSIYWMHFSGKMSQEYLRMLQGPDASPTIYVPCNHAIIDAFEEIYRWCEEGPTDGNLIAASTATVRFFGLLTVMRRSKDVRFRNSEQRIHDSMIYMRAHVNRQLSIDDLAEQVDLSASHYSTLFKMATGISPIHFFLQLKIRLACELLETTSKQVTKISQELGYEDPYYFSRLFKKIIGKSPIQYRKSPRETHPGPLADPIRHERDPLYGFSEKAR